MPDDDAIERDRRVPWETYGALLRSEIGNVDDLQLAGGVRLVPMPDWIADGDVLCYMSERTRRSLREFRYALAVRYEADSLGMPDAEWGPDEVGTPRSVQQHAERRLVLAALALWLVRPTHETIAHLIHARCDDGQWFVPQVRGGVDVVLPHPQDSAEALDAETIRRAGPVHEALLGLEEGTTLFLALDALLQGLGSERTVIRFLMTWVAAEAIFGTKHELAYRLSARVAALLRPHGPDRRALFEIVKRGYGWRCKAVHGTELAKFKYDVWVRESHAVETWLREAICKILLNDDFCASVQGNTRDAFLDDLHFGSDAQSE